MHRFTVTSEDHLETVEKKGAVVVANHLFENGELVVNDDEAKKLEPILCRFYGCKMEKLVEAAAEAEDAEPSLASSQTK